ncbi:MAG: hypothetical protein COB02_13380 [Candidatus Cloacimonadota bacterium]|nr:MAG: hypothetical protein COB02_13380 [Candidatus Cloacimonadota bacterium]
MKKWVKIVLGICVISSCSFASEESVGDMIFRIFGKKNEVFEQKLETGLAMGTIQEDDLEEIIRDYQQEESVEESDYDSEKGEKGEKGFKSIGVLSISRVSDCFETLYKMTKNPKLYTVGKRYRQHFKDNGKPLKPDDAEISDSPFAQTKLPTIMIDYSKCLYSVSLIKKKISKWKVEDKKKVPADILNEEEETLDRHNEEMAEDLMETGAQTVVSEDDENSSDEGEINVSASMTKSVIRLYTKNTTSISSTSNSKLKISPNELNGGLKSVTALDLSNRLNESSNSEAFQVKIRMTLDEIIEEAKKELSKVREGSDNSYEYLGTMWNFSKKHLKKLDDSFDEE